jgi:hypothetical protein
MKLTKKINKRSRRKVKSRRRQTSKNRMKKGGMFGRIMNRIRPSKKEPNLPTIIEEDRYNERSSFDNQKINQLRREINRLSNNETRLNLIKQIAEAELEEAQEDYNKRIENDALCKEMSTLSKNLDASKEKLKLNIKNIEENNKELEQRKRELDMLDENLYRGGNKRRRK